MAVVPSTKMIGDVTTNRALDEFIAHRFDYIDKRNQS